MVASSLGKNETEKDRDGRVGFSVRQDIKEGLTEKGVMEQGPEEQTKMVNVIQKLFSFTFVWVLSGSPPPR